MVSKRNFYKRKDKGKKVLKQTIRPTYNDTDLDDDLIEEMTPKSNPVDVDEAEATAEATSDDNTTPSSNKVEESISTKSKALQTEIDEISAIIKKATSRLEQLEKERQEQERLEAEKAASEVVEDFDGVDSTDEEIELIKEQLAYQQKQNKKLKHELTAVKEEFEKEKKSLEKKIKGLKKEIKSSDKMEDNKAFSFSKELRTAIDAISNLNDSNFTPVASQVVVAPQPGTATSVPIADAAPAVVPQQTETPQPVPSPKVINIDAPPTTAEASPAATAPTPHPVAVQPQASEKQTEKRAPKDKKKVSKKGKKLLITGAAAMVIMLLGGGLTVSLVTRPKVNQALVDEYLAQNQSQVLGTQSQAGVVPEGVVADKNGSVSLEETKWAEYRDPSFGIVMSYPANVTERLHSSNSITFLRKDSYIFKVTKVTTELDLVEYWESIKGKGIAYTAEESELANIEALYLEIQEEVDYPGDRYLIKVGDTLFDIWFANDPTVYATDDIERAARMVDSIKFL